MYRLVLYFLVVLWLIALGFSLAGILSYDPLSMILSGVLIFVACLVSNLIFAKIFEAPANVESVYITAFILMLIISPTRTVGEAVFIFWAALLAIASKYILAIGKKHIFNPAAFAVALIAVTINHSASWWVGTLPLLPFVAIGGALIVRKIIRFDLVLSFLITALISVGLGALINGGNPFTGSWGALINSGLLFFAFIMITEPLTTPPTRRLRILYGMLVGLLFAPQIHIGPVYSTPELALIVGNIFSYLVSPKKKLILTLQKLTPLTADTADLIFTSDKKLNFRPGQYLEWTLGHEKPDGRGNRRYFTIASSPTESTIRLGVKFYPEASSFKKFLIGMKPGNMIVASQLAGDFTLPNDLNKKLVFIAGGIGITPFRSMAKYMIDAKEARDAVLLFSNKTAADIIYRDIFDAAGSFGLRTIYTLTDMDKIPAGWQGERGFVTPEMITAKVPDYQERLFYISGPRAMVVAFEITLKRLGVHHSQIITDYFPGFA